MRLKDKLINERIELPGWDKIEERINTFKNTLLRMEEGSFLMNLLFFNLFSATIKRNKMDEDDRG
jgi:hypothetical protein